MSIKETVQKVVTYMLGGKLTPLSDIGLNIRVVLSNLYFVDISNEQYAEIREFIPVMTSLGIDVEEMSGTIRLHYGNAQLSFMVSP